MTAACCPGLSKWMKAYIGGKPRKRNRRDDDTPSPRGRATRKTPIVGAVERGGRVKTKMVAHGEMTGDDMEEFAREILDLPRTVLTTDEYGGYGQSLTTSWRTASSTTASPTSIGTCSRSNSAPTHTNTMRELLGHREASFCRPVPFGERQSTCRSI